MADHKLETVNVVGVRADGSAQVLGQAPMPPKMKAREIVRSYFGRIDEDAGDEGAMALWACQELIDWMAQQAAAPANPPIFVANGGSEGGEG